MLMIVGFNAAYGQATHVQHPPASSSYNVRGALGLEATDIYGSGTGQHEYQLLPNVELELRYTHSDTLNIGLGFEYSRELEGGNNSSPSEYTTSFTLDEAYLEIANRNDSVLVHNDTILSLGRKRIRDSREWFYDTQVDGFIVQMMSSDESKHLFLSLNREQWINSDFLHHHDSDPVNNLIVAFEYQPQRKFDIGAFVIVRNDTSSEHDSPHFVGISARADVLDNRLSFWTDFAAVDGEDGDEGIKGHGFDVGVTLKSTTEGMPYVTLSYAFGSGDGDEDTDFRQSGFQDNSGEFGGVTNFKYYGELFDPELSNLKILTAGIGFRPRKKISMDLIYHRYEQDTPLDELRDSSLPMAPNGQSSDIGTEWDLIAGFEHLGNIKIEIALGYFMPGAAFDDRSELMLLDTKITYDF